MDKRARALQGEYRTKAKDIDEEFVGTPKGQVGPVERKLDQFGQMQGFVFGAFGEGSEDIHKMVKILAESRLKAVELQRGRVGLKGELGMITGQIRRMLSVGAAKRREYALMEDYTLRREQEAQFAGFVRGTQLVRRGFFKLPRV